MDINRIRIPKIFLLLFIIYFLLIPLSIQASSRGISVISDLSHQSGKLGEYRALIIGINNYNDPKIPDLETAVNDAQTMAKLLREHYGFQIELLLDHKATKEAIFRSLRKLVSSTKPDDSVLIYYAGHGDLDRLTNEGWWIPADARGGNPITYLDNFLVQTYIRSMQARHVLLISDSCYSGTLFGQARAMPQVIGDKYYLNLYNEKSRWGMTSGNKTPVSDQGSGGHSVFAYQLLKELRKNEKPYLSTQEIYTRIAPIISNNSEQTPLCRPIRNTGDQGGEFIFVASSGAVVEKPSPEPSNAYLSVESNVSSARVSVDGRYVGTTRLSDVKIASGEHSIRVEKDGYETKKLMVTLGSGEDKSIDVRLIKLAVPPSSYSSYSSAREIKRDGRFIAYDNGDVKDTKTGLIWASKDNGKDINWEDAKRYCENYRGGGYTDWRMPTQDELAALYDKSEVNQATQKYHNVYLTKLIELSTCCLWASETNGWFADTFNFREGRRYTSNQSSSVKFRALPVRSGK